MSSKVRVVCPGCQTELRVSKSAGIVECPACSKKMRLKPTQKPEHAASQSIDPTGPNAFAFPNLTDLSTPELPDNFTWNQHARRKQLIQVKPLLISFAIVIGGIAIGGIFLLLKNLSSRIDVAVMTDALRGPDDSVTAIHADWNRNVAEHQRLLASIQRRSDCTSLLIPFESLIRRQTELVARSALLATSHQSAFNENLPPMPTEREPGSRTFRAVDSLLTTELRELDEQLSVVSNALLRFFHVEAAQLFEPKGEEEQRASQRIAMKRQVVRWLASVVHGTETNEASVAIYELAEEVKKLPADALTTPTLRTGSQAVNEAEKAVDQMRFALEAFLVKSQEEPMAKSLAAFDAAW